jgi:hypothetical protein
MPPGPRSYLFADCITCGETNPAALMRYDGGFICGNCEARERGRPERVCARCGEMAPFERHHIHGRKNSDELEDRCINVIESGTRLRNDNL